MVKIRSRTDIQNSEFTIASGATTDLSTTYSNRILVTGTTTITSFGTVSSDTPDFVLRFSGSLTITHNSTTLILPQGRNIITNVGDTIVLQSLGSGNWRCVAYFREDGSALSSNESNSFSVRVATTTAGTLATGFENGDIIDGVTLVTGDVILIKDQSSGSENGIYTVNASGSPTRVYYYNDDRSIRRSIVFSREGTLNGGLSFQNSNTSTITVGSTTLTYIENTPTSTIISMTAGEAITQGDAIAIDRFQFQPYTATLEAVFGDTGVRTRIATQFTTPVFAISASQIQVRLRRTGTPTATTITVRIETDSAGLPSGTVVTNATATINPGTLTTSLANYTLNFAGTVSLSASTTYHVAFFHDGTMAAANDFRAAATSGTNLSAENNGSSWSEANNPAQFVLPSPSLNQAIKADARSTQKIDFVGFARSTVTSGQNISVSTSGTSVSQSGLTPGSRYFLSDTPGSISTTPGTFYSYVGTAYSASQIGIVKNRDKIGNLPAATSITVGTSPFTYFNTTENDILVSITAGTISNIQYRRVTTNFGPALSSTGQIVRISSGDSIVVTHSSTPTMSYIIV